MRKTLKLVLRLFLNSGRFKAGPQQFANNVRLISRRFRALFAK